MESGGETLALAPTSPGPGLPFGLSGALASGTPIILLKLGGIQYQKLYA